MPSGYVIAFDYGLKHIGVAVGQTVTGTSRGIQTLSARQGKPQWHEIEKLIAEYQPGFAVVGYPLNMDGSVSDMAERASRFARQLTTKFELQAHLHDERLTSREAKELFPEAQALGQANSEHELAACLILNSYLAQHKD